MNSPATSPAPAPSMVEGWSLPTPPEGFKPIAEVGDDGFALSWSRCPDDDAALDGDNWTHQPEIPWPFQVNNDEWIPFAVAIPALVALGFTIREY